MLLVNFSSNHTGGGISVCENFVKCVRNSKTSDRKIIFILPKNFHSRFEESDDIVFLQGLGGNGSLSAIFRSFFWIPYLIWRYKVSKIINFSDIPIITSVEQVHYLDWPYVLYPGSIREYTFGIKKIKAILKNFFFRISSRFVDRWICQSDSLKQRAINSGLSGDINVIPNSISSEFKRDLLSVSKRSVVDSREIQFYYLTAWYEHKNLGIIPCAIARLRDLGIKFKFILTLDVEDKAVRNFLKSIDDHGLEEYVCNVGPVPYKDLLEFYSTVDVLVMPTLLETFSSAYLEALAAGKLIITSNKDFASDVCGDAAFYIDPLSPESLASRLRLVISLSGKEWEDYQEVGYKQLDKFPSWSNIIDRFFDA